MSTRKPRVRHQYSKRLNTAFDFTEGGQTQQHFQEECDINSIMARYLKTGILDHVRETQAQYGFAPSESFTESMFIVSQAKEEFAKLPSEIRAHFQNDPAAFLDAAGDPSRESEFVELGLIPPPETPEAENPAQAPVEPVSEAQAE